MNKRTLLLLQLLLLLFLPVRAQQASAFTPSAFKTPNVLKWLPNKEVQTVYQGSDDRLWICTRNGLFHYDGYELKCYKSNLAHPDLLTSNNILCVAEDAKHRLWIGTYSGLNVLDLINGQIRKIDNVEMNRNTISTILVTSDQRILLGTDWGLYEYIEEKDDFYSFTPGNTEGVLPKTSIKSLMEDHRGDLWIGTWNEGLFRYDRHTEKYFRYPRLNAQNSAHVLMQDSKRRIWVGTWRGGLVLLNNAYEPNHVRPVIYRNDSRRPTSLSDDIIYSLAENRNTGDIWIGTRHGLSILPAADEYDGTENFQNIYHDPNAPHSSIASDEVTSFLFDREGIIWIGMIGGGVDKIDIRPHNFNYENLSFINNLLHTSSVRSMLMDKEGLLWLGVGSYGFGVYDRKTKHFLHYMQMPEFAHKASSTTTVTSIRQSATDGHIWITAYDDGVYEIDKTAAPGRRVTHYTVGNGTPWLPGDCVYQVYEDSKHNLWFATRNGVTMRSHDGQMRRFDSLYVDKVRMHQLVTTCLTEDREGYIWGGTATQGVFRLKPDGSAVSTYCIANNKLKAKEINCIYPDADGRLWVGTNNSGLHLYDADTDTFLPVHELWKLPGNAVTNIESDNEGNLWVSTDSELLRLTPSDKDDERPACHLYTIDDGLQANAFSTGASTKAADGELFFGGYHGFNSFYPERLKENDYVPSVAITDIRIFNQSWETLPADERNAISERSPYFADHLVLDHRHNNFSFEFSAMDYTRPELNVYAYRLKGFDKDWQYTNASKRYASYNNLPPGNYTFLLKAAGTNGVWNESEHSVKVTVLPSPWKTWWAYLLYILAVVAALTYVYRTMHNRMQLQNSLRIREMEKEKVEEMNHVKLQFFTNITHELLTPLSILQASVDELRRIAPAYKEQYRVMSSNINRLIRLLQQILEFRKAESGNLKLRVSQQDLVQFICRSLESFRPLMHHKDITLTFDCPLVTLNAWFDTDKVDKILYNLLSNASKYNHPGGKVQVELRSNDDGTATFAVRDNGNGIPQSEQKNIFKRFYEGDYRRHNTIGTGIGLSLVHDLVELHHGTITVESEENRGAAFIVTIPVIREAYTDDEVERPGIEKAPKPKKATEPVVPLEPDDSDDAAPASEKANASHPYSLLVVEDNEDMLQLMTNLLQTEYKVYAVTGAKAGLELLEKEHIDLIVSDVMMDEMDGLTFCRTVKEKEGSANIPVILLTAKNREEDRIDAYEAGADAFISKPFNLSVLQARIGNLLTQHKRREKEEEKQLVFNVKDYSYTASDKDFLESCIECINRHISEPDFTQQQFAEEMNMSKSTLFRRIKQLTGNGVSYFISYTRIKMAAHIMDEHPELTINELAFMVGFNDPRYFSICFKKQVGVNPSDYIRMKNGEEKEK